MPGPGEEAWTEDDVEYALEWQLLKAEGCPECGEPRAESFDGANEDAYDVHTLRCHACAAKGAKQAEIAENDNADTDGLFLIVQKRRPDERRRGSFTDHPAEGQLG